MSDWITLLGPVSVAIAILLLPGAVVGAMLGLRGVALLGLAAPISVAVLGVSAAAAPLLAARFAPAVPLTGTIVAGLLALSLRRWRQPPTRPRSGSDIAVLAAAAAAALASAIVAFGALPSPSLVSQTYDGVFHVNAVAWILDTGDASSLHLYRMTHPGDDIEFYPAAWHGLVALVVQTTGCSIPVATNAAWLAVNGAVLSLGSAFLAVVLLPRAQSRTLIAVVAALGATATAASPYVLLRWGVLYPTGLAYALLPAGLALAVIASRDLHSRRFWFDALLLATWLAASVFAHPRSLVSFALLASPLLLGALVLWARAGLLSEERRRRTATLLAAGIAVTVIAAVVGSAIVLDYFGAAERPIAERLNGGPATARQSLTQSVLQALTLAPPSGPGEATLPVTVVMASAVLVGLVLALLRPGTRWLAVGYVLIVVLYSLAAGSNDDFAKLATGFWYKDKFRLFALLGVLAPALLAILADKLLLTARRTRWTLKHRWLRRTVAPALMSLVILAGWSGPSLDAMRYAMPLDWTVSNNKDGRLLDRAEFELLSELPDLVEPGAVVVGNPWNGSALSWALGDRQPLFPHMTGEWDVDRQTIAARLDLILSDPGVCAALGRLGADYLFASDGLLWGGDPQAVQYEAVDRAGLGVAGFELIAEKGGSRLYRITACP